MKEYIYIIMKPNAKLAIDQYILIKDVAKVVCNAEYKETIENMAIGGPMNKKNKIVSVTIQQIIEKIYQLYPYNQISFFGSSQTIVLLQENKKMDVYVFIKLVIASILLFIGAGFTIMNFHADVNMIDAQRVIHRVITGETKERPILLNLSYSIGIGLGMLIFFNHISNSNAGGEPSPLELEMDSYDQSVNQYIVDNINSQDSEGEGNG